MILESVNYYLLVESGLSFVLDSENNFAISRDLVSLTFTIGEFRSQFSFHKKYQII